MDSLLSLEVDHRGFVSEADRDAFFRHQLKLPENTTCFDCGFNNPKWTSVSFAIYLCLNCSGRHRQLGSHISFVRSVDMDRFTRDQLVRLLLGGNGSFMSFLNSHNLFQRPLNYSNDRLLAYTARLDADLAKHVPKNTPKPTSEPKEDLLPDLDNMPQQHHPEADPASVVRGLHSPLRTETLESSVRDDAEKLSNVKSDAFGDLLDLRSVSSDDLKVGATVAEPPVNDSTFVNSVVEPRKDSLDVFDNLAQPPVVGSAFKFDTFSEFVSDPPEKPEKSKTNDSLFNLDFAKPNLASGSLNSFAAASQLPKEPVFKDSKLPRSKFASRVNDFDFDSFEKQNKLQSSFAAAAATPDTSAAFAAAAPAPAFGASSSPFSSSAGAFGTATFGSSAVTAAPQAEAPASFKNVSSTSRPKVHASPSFSAQSTSLTGNTPFGSGQRSPLATEALAGTLPKPDLSKFEGKKAISSDAFFGNTPSQTNVSSQVSPNRLAFSSDDYFGRPRQDVQHMTTIEEQALQNLNEIKANIEKAINKGGVLLEKARNWLYTNYY